MQGESKGGEIRDFPKAVLRRLNSVQGWLNLGDWEEARVELEGIDASFQSHPLLLCFRVEICRAAGDWKGMAEISRHLCEIQPDEAGHWLNYSYSSRRSAGLAEAKLILTQAKKHFKNNALIYFNLACYHAQLGELGEARGNLAEAIQMDPAWRDAALKDPDLEMLWGEIRGETV